MNVPSPDELSVATGGRYEINELFASGGMGAVFLARHKTLQSRVAIKVLPPEVGLSAVRLARFKREASVASRLSHPNIVPVFEFDVKDDLAFLVMPFIEGGGLEAYIAERGPLPWEEVRAIIAQIGSALAFAHARGVIHRDVKPSNILRERDTGRWLLTDFGIAHVGDPSGAEDITQTGASMGTPAYMPPEQIGTASEVDARSDLFALAAVAYESLTGVRPDWAEGPDALCRALQARRPDIPAPVARTLTKALAAARDERPESVDAWLADLATRRSIITSRSTIAAAAALVLAASAWAVYGRSGATDPAALPSVAVLPFDVTGSANGISLDSLLPVAFDWQLRMLPEVRVIGAPVVNDRITRRYGNAPQSVDTLARFAATFGATQIVSGRADVAGERVTIHVQVHETTGRIVASADTTGSLDSLHALVAGLVVETFAERLARERTGWVPSLPRGLTAVAEYFEGDRDFRRGSYERAIERFDRVIQLDSTYAPAYFKRMLAMIQQQYSEDQLRSALAAVTAYSDRLDPVSARLLEGYRILVDEGDINGAATVFRDITNDHPDAVDAWFVLGMLQFHFAPLLRTPVERAEAAFLKVVQLDPTFAAPLGQLIQIAVAREDEPRAREYMRRYLDIDSASVVAQLVAAAETLLYHRQAAPRVIASFPNRPTAFLENVALIAMQFGRGAGERAAGRSAIDALWERAGTSAEKAIVFRMRIASAMAEGRERLARELVRQGPANRVPADEIDRWQVLSGVTAIPNLGTEDEIGAAADRLLRARENPAVARWLAARWYRSRDPRRARVARDDLDRIARATKAAAPLEGSLLRDLVALDTLAAGDTSAALAIWDQATQRFSIAQVPLALVASLWPLRAERVLVAAAAGRSTEVLDAAVTFTRFAGFVDQVALPAILNAQVNAFLAQGDSSQAIDTYATLARLLGEAQGSSAVLRDSVRARVR